MHRPPGRRPLRSRCGGRVGAHRSPPATGRSTPPTPRSASSSRSTPATTPASAARPGSPAARSARRRGWRSRPTAGRCTSRPRVAWSRSTPPRPAGATHAAARPPGERGRAAADSRAAALVRMRRSGAGASALDAAERRGACAPRARTPSRDRVGSAGRVGRLYRSGRRGVGGAAQQRSAALADPTMRDATHPQRLGPAERDVGGEVSSWPSTSASSGHRRASSSTASSASSLPSAEPRQKWMPRPKARWRRAFSRSTSKASGSGKTDGVAPRRRQPQEELRARGQVDAADGRGPGRHAPPDADRRIEAQRLLHGPRDRLRFGDDRSQRARSSSRRRMTLPMR